MENLIEHVDSPYIRCIGFLYLRYVCDPKELWDWFMPYLYDVEKVQVCEGNKRCGKGQGTVGDFVRSLLYDLEFFGTRLPRLPQGVEKEIKSKLMQEGEIENRAVGHEQDKRRMDYFQKVGNKVIAMYGDEENAVTWYDAVIDRVLWKDDETGYQFTRPKFIVTFAEVSFFKKIGQRKHSSQELYSHYFFVSFCESVWQYRESLFRGNGHTWWYKWKER